MNSTEMVGTKIIIAKDILQGDTTYSTVSYFKSFYKHYFVSHISFNF